MPLPRILVLIDATTTHTSHPSLPATITHVISNKKAGIPSTYHNLRTFQNQRAHRGFPAAESRRLYDAELARLILAQQPDLVVCAGWMHILSPTCLDPLMGAGVDIINLHPALPGAFDGVGAVERAFEAWKRGEVARTGVMVHHVIHAVDRGEPIVVREVEMREGDRLVDLEERIHAVELVEIVGAARMALEQRAEKRKRKRKMVKS